MIENFIIEIKNGKVEFKSEYHRELFNNYIQQYSDGKYRLNIEMIKENRSEQQNRYYFLYLGLISKYTGYTVEDLHEWAKGKFLSKSIKEIFGDKVREKKSTTKLSKGKFCEFLFEIEQATLPITDIPLPDTSEFLGYSFHERNYHK